MREIGDEERRARLARRHGLAAGLPSVPAVAEALTALHATEAATVHLALWARVEGVTVADVDRSLYEDRTIVKQLAMRRTLFAFPRDLLPAVWGSAARRVAGQQRALIAKDVRTASLHEDPETWIDAAREAVLTALEDGEPRTTAELREKLPELAGRVTRGTPDKRWTAEAPIAPRVLTLLGAEGRVVRGPNAGHWRLNRPTWTLTERWLGAPADPLPEQEGYAALVRGWLRACGPGTEADLVWWLGATKATVRRALADLDAVRVRLDGGSIGWVLTDDVEPVEPVEPWAALLPALDPTVMGWKERGFYLDPADAPYLFDRNGNGGTTAWWDGRVVGCWVQDPEGVVRVVLRREVDGAGRSALDAEADRLAEWLGGVRISNVYASPLMKGAVLG